MQAIRMFGEERVGVILKDMRHALKVAKKESEPDVPVLELQLLLQPLTLELASALSVEMRRMLFRFKDGEPRQEMKSVGFTLGIPPQNVSFYPAPDVNRQSIVLRDCDIGKIVMAKADKDTRGWTLAFKACYRNPNGKVLDYLQDKLNKQLFVEFEPTDATLDFEPLAPTEDEEKEDEAIRASEGELAQGEFGAQRAAAVAGVKEPARRPSFRHRDKKARQRAKQAKKVTRKRGRRSGVAGR